MIVDKCRNNKQYDTAVASLNFITREQTVDDVIL